MKKKKTDSSSSNRKIKARINYFEIVKFMVTEPVQGPDGVFKAIREAINNSLDVHATNFKIKIGEFEGSPAVIISDNGEGFNHAAIKSVMSYAVSSKERSDIKTIGANGTGVKHFLGLGDIEKTKVTILSVSKEIPTCTRMDLTFEYLVSLAEKKVKADDYVSTVTLPSDWQQDVKRETGATLILTGFDKRKVRKPEFIISELCEYITPRAAEYVSIFNGNTWVSPTPKKMKGNTFSYECDTAKLGNIAFELSYGGYGDGPVVCGSTNAILPLTQLWSKMDKDQRGRIAKVWKTISGYIYIQRANYYRQHNGSFSDEFFETETTEEFVLLLQMVSGELEKLTEQSTDEKSQREKQQLLARVIDAAKQLAHPEFSVNGSVNGGDRPFSLVGDVDKDLYILPKRLNLWPGETQTITLRNSGTKVVDFTDAQWSVNGDCAVITNAYGATAVVTAKKVGSVSIKVSGSFGEHVIQVVVDHVSSTPFIKGPAYVRPGDMYLFELKRYEKSEVYWKVEHMPLFIQAIPDIEDKKKYSLQVGAECPDCTLTLSVYARHLDKLIAKKVINVLEEGGRKQLPVLRIGKKDYLLNVGNYYPDTVAQIDYAFSDSPIPEIVVNPLHPRVRKLSNFYATEPILVAIANVAIMDQISQGIVRISEAQAIVEQFVNQVKEKIFENTSKIKEAVAHS